MTLPVNLPVLSRVTIQNPRPRKFASSAERQKAFRERFPTLTVRVEEAQAEAIRRIADEQGRTQHKQLPRFQDLKDNPNRKTSAASEPYDDPELWAAAKDAAREQLAGHSARAMQLAGRLYRAAGGGYRGRKSAAQRSLTSWTKQDWTTRSGKRSRDTGERYLPRRVIEQLTPQEYAATTRAKRKGTTEGKQFVAQPAKIRAKVARLTREDNPMARTPTPAQRAARERFAQMARSGAFKRKAKRNPARKKAASSLSPETTVYKRYSIISPTSSDTVYIVRSGTNIGSARSIAEAKKIIDMLTEGVDNPRSSNPVLLIRDVGKGKRRQRNPAKRMKMLNISWMTPGGAREFKAVPVEFTFTHRVGNDPFRFFVRNENNFLVVSEYSTGGRIGQVPYAMRAAASDDRAAAKQFVGEMLSRVGEYRFRAAVAQFTPIN